MIQRHYDDEAIMSMLDAVPPAADIHFGHCPACSEKMDSFRMVADALRDSATWDQRPVDETPSRSTISVLRAFAGRAAAEDTLAHGQVKVFLAGPRLSWKDVLAAHPEYRTGGMVRRLLTETDRALDTMPIDAVELTALATEIADHLDDRSYEGDAVTRLRGAAWRDHAYALYYTGQFVEAERALQTAERHFASCIVDEYDLARLGIVKALVMRAFERFAEASSVAEASTRVFLRHGDLSRFASAQMAEAHMLFSSRDYAKAAELLAVVEAKMQHSDDVATHARVCGNLAFSLWNLGKPDAALQYHDAAASMFDALGVATEAARVRWLAALMLARAGQVDVAYERFVTVRSDFERLGMTSEAAVVSLDIAEILLTRGDYDQAERTCRWAMQLFESVQVAHTARALTALAFIHEAVRSRKATPAVFSHVRDFIRRVPHEEQLRFAPPPEWQ